jgi:hypothetical protein
MLVVLQMSFLEVTYGHLQRILTYNTKTNETVVLHLCTPVYYKLQTET